jgi:hypothetical protein
LNKNETKRLAKAKRLVKKPAIALLVTGILMLVPSLGMMWLCFHENRLGSLFLSLTAVAAAVVAFISGFNMMQLRKYQLCIVGSIVVMLPVTVFRSASGR